MIIKLELFCFYLFPVIIILVINNETIFSYEAVTILFFLAMLTQESIGFGARESEVATCILTHLYLSVPELLTLKKL